MHLAPGRMAPRVVAWVFLAISYAVPATVQAGALERKNDGGGITITALYVPASDALEFRLTLDTHGGDLMKYDMAALTLLRVNGQGEAVAVGWKDDAKGSHHRSGVIRFARLDPASSGALTLEIVVRGVGGVPERILRWDLAKA